jgi:hypothetical protein
MGMQFLALDKTSSRQIESFVYERAQPAPLPGAASGSSAG